MPRTEVVLFDADGSTTTAAAGRWATAVPSPDGEWVATFSDLPVGARDPEAPLRRQVTYATRPGVVPLLARNDESGAGDTAPFDALDDPLARTLRWAPDGSAFALLTRVAPEGENDPGIRVAVYRPGAEHARLVGDSTMQIDGFAWTGDGTLLVNAQWRGNGSDAEEPHWWRPPAASNGEWENWTAGMETIPDDLVPVSGGVAGIADGALWQLADGNRERILDPERANLRRLIGPAPWFRPGRMPQTRSPGDPVRVLAVSRDGPALWTVPEIGDDGEEVRRLPMPRGARMPADVVPGGTSAAFSASNDEGTWLWRSHSAGAPNLASGDRTAVLDTLVTRDQWVEDIDGADARQLTYTGPDGDELTAWILLPPGREPDGAHPTVTWVYPGQVHGERVPRLAQLNGTVVSSGIAALQLLPSRGYAVLIPSVPLGPDDSGTRPNLADAVIPAVDRAIDAGLTDSSTVAVMGQSYGGFGVNHLVSQTDRFEAAVASASFSHLRSLYGTFDARGRYGHMAHPLALQLFTHAYVESGQGQMGAPPALASQTYREASPLSYVDQVDTPLMLIHGDQDFVPVQQAEMFFNELVRLGKPAVLVRYAGEGHTVSGRANVLDMWDRIFGWFEHHLGTPRPSTDRTE